MCVEGEKCKKRTGNAPFSLLHLTLCHPHGHTRSKKKFYSKLTKVCASGVTTTFLYCCNVVAVKQKQNFLKQVNQSITYATTSTSTTRASYLNN